MVRTQKAFAMVHLARVFTDYAQLYPQQLWITCAALTRLALTGRFSDGLAFRENLAFIRRNLGSYFVSLLLYIAAGMLAMVGYLACFVGIFVTSFWFMVVSSMYRSNSGR